MKHKEKKIYTQTDFQEKTDNYHILLLDLIKKRYKEFIIKFTNINKLDYLNSQIQVLIENLNIKDSDFITSTVNIFDKMENLDEYIINYLNQENFSNRISSEIISDFTFLSEIIETLLMKIKDSIEDVATPLSGEIFELKKGLNSFSKSFINWRDEMNDEKNRNNYNNVITSFNKQSENFIKLGDLIGHDFISISDSLNSVTEMFNKISNDTKKIEDIASNIKTLSINASIEASRAGEHGKGFKVIAAGTQELSDKTNTLLESIVNTVKDTKKIIHKTTQYLNDETKIIQNSIEFQNSGYEMFYNVLKDFYSKFQIVFDDIVNGTKETFKHIDKVTPMIQLHDGLEQQLGNMSLIISNINNKNKHEIDKKLEQIPSNNTELRKNDIITEIENKITTDIEVDVISTIVKKHNLKRKKNIEVIHDDIEMF